MPSMRADPELKEPKRQPNWKTWKFRDIRWGTVFSRQDYANLCGTAILIIVLAIVEFTATPRHPDYVIYDASISFPHVGNPTVPSWVPFVIPLIMLIATLVVGEVFHSSDEHKSVTDCVATIVYFVLDGLQAFVFTMAMTVIFKVICGRLRPDFLMRCDPGLAGDNALAVLNVGVTNTTAMHDCVNAPDEGSLKDGYKSFPSGHSSAGFVLTVYASAYLIWCFHMRKREPAHHLTFAQKFRQDFRNVIAKYWMLGMMMFAWGVAISRVLDYQHNYSDILGGAFLGTVAAIVYALRAIPRYKRTMSPDALAKKEEDEQQLGLNGQGLGASHAASDSRVDAMEAGVGGAAAVQHGLSKRDGSGGSGRGAGRLPSGKVAAEEAHGQPVREVALPSAAPASASQAGHASLPPSPAQQTEASEVPLLPGK